MKFVCVNLDDRIKSGEYQQKLLEDWNNGNLVEWLYYTQWSPCLEPTKSRLQQAVKRYDYLLSHGVSMIAVTDTGQRIFRDAKAVSALSRLLFGAGFVKASSEVKSIGIEKVALQCWKGVDATIVAVTFDDNHDREMACLKKTGLDIQYCKPSSLGYCYMLELHPAKEAEQ